MTDETKQEIEAVLMLLKNTLVRNGVSIALAGSEDTGKDDGCIMFFDTAEYCRTGKFKGISVKTMDLVRQKYDGVYEEHGEEVTGRAGRNGK